MVRVPFGLFEQKKARSISRLAGVKGWQLTSEEKVGFDYL
jgi:hypothetical protein